MRQANSLGVRYAVIVGDEEVRAGAVTVRDMVNAHQKTVPLGDLPGLLK
jgi:histidyl-tRNA synthetase